MTTLDIVVEALLAMSQLLEDSGEGFNDDDAVHALEVSAHILSKMNDDQRAEFRETLNQLSASPEWSADYIRSVPFSLGWDSDPPRSR